LPSPKLKPSSDFVILVDAYILIYSHVESFAQHQAAHAWLDQQLNGSAHVGLLLAFLRLVTNPRVFERPKPMVTWSQNPYEHVLMTKPD
jgi:predicted nucleic acid-binding protein